MASRPGASSSSVCVGWILHLGTNAESRHIYGDRAATEASLMPLGSGTRLLPSGSVADRGGGDAEHRDVVRQVPTVGLVDDVAQAHGLPGVTFLEDPEGGFADRVDDLDCAIGSQQRRRMAGRGHQDLVAVGADPREAAVGDHLPGGPVAPSTSWSPSSTSPSPWPVSVSALQATRSATPTAAPSGPCPATSPISVATVPSGSSRAS